jgi:hypothetical protein
MAIARYYNADVFGTSTWTAAGGAVASTSSIPILAGTTVAGNDINISAVRVSCLGASAFPSNASWAGSLNIATGTAGAGTAVTPRLLGGGSALAAKSTWLTAGGSGATAVTGLTLSTGLWSQEVPFTAGANWGEWVTPGFEMNVAVSSVVALYITCSSAGTGTTFGGSVEFTE